MLYRHRLFIAATLGTAIGFVSFYLQFALRIPGDFLLPLCGAKNLISGLDPYACPPYGNAPYPLTTILALIPLSWLPVEIASALIVGISTGLLAYALNRPQEPWRLLAFISVPFVYSVQISQWAPLFLAAVYIKWLYPVVLIKPQLGLSVALMNFTTKRFVLVFVLGLLSLVVYPNWILHWWQRSIGYDGFIPALSIPGMFLLLAVIRWRTEPAKWLLILSLTPQRGWYDQLMLWTIPSNKQQMFLLTVCSWVMWLPLIILGPRILGNYGNLWLIMTLFYPALGIVLTNKQVVQLKQPARTE